VAAPIIRAAIFLVVTLKPGVDNRAALRSFCGDFSALLRAVEFRDLEAGLSCVVGFGPDAWDRLWGPPRPAELRVFREIRGGGRHAVSTPGDLLFHIRAKRMDLCFELARKSWRVSEMLFRQWTKFRASATLTIVICWVSSMGRKIPGVRRRSTR
jgi:putative iron-dependent peroxidase